jgi:hypothetical protein
MCLWVSYCKKYEKIFFFASFKSLKKCVGSELDPDQLDEIQVWIRIRTKMSRIPQHCWKLKLTGPLSRRHLKKKFFCIILFEGTFTSYFKGQKSKRSHKTVEIKVFLTIFA